MDPLGEWTVDAKEALQITLYNRGEIEPKEAAHSFNPEFAYSVFGENETIYGYKDLEVNLRFAANDCKPFAEMMYSEMVKKVGDVEAEDALGELKQHLPEDTLNSVEEFNEHIQSYDPAADFTPPGSLIESYSLEERTFEVWYAPLSSSATQNIFKYLQIFTLFYIEGGTEISLEDEEWTTNRWNIYFLYEKLEDGQYSIVGYCTVYQYWLFRRDVFEDKSRESIEKGEFANDKDIQLLRARISQFVILPPYQRRGHGGKYYDIIVDNLLSTSNVQEITVEDPNESFMDLRDVRDFQRLKRNGTFNTLSFRTYADKSWDVEEHRKKNKMPPRQFKRMVELELLQQLNKKDGKQYKQYRMIVKGRVYKMHRDILAQLDRLERIDKLDETYHHVEDDYYRLLNKLKAGDPSEEQQEADDEPPRKRIKI